MKKIVLAVLISAMCVQAGISQATDPLYVVIVDNKRGYIDKTGKIVIAPRFDGASDFSEGLASVAVSANGYGEGYIDETGKIVIEPQWDTASDFKEGVAWVGLDQAKQEIKIGNRTYYSTPTHSSDYKFGLIDRTGKYIVEPTFTLAADFSEGLASVRTAAGKFGFINKDGDFVIPPSYEWADSFSEGLAWVYVKGKYGFIDKQGKLVIKPQFTDAQSFSEGLAAVKLGGATREPGFGYRSITIKRTDTNYAFIDKTGRIVFKVKAESAYSFSEGLARFTPFGGNGEGFVDHSGKVVIEPTHGGISDFSEGLKFSILDGGRIGYIDKTGKVVLKPPFALAEDFKNGLARVSDSLDIMKVKYGYIDRHGKVIWQPTR